MSGLRVYCLLFRGFYKGFGTPVEIRISAKY